MSRFVFGKVLRTRVVAFEKHKEEEFKTWAEELTHILISEMAKFNPELDSLNRDINICEKKIHENRKDKDKLIDCERFIGALLAVQGGEEID